VNINYLTTKGESALALAVSFGQIEAMKLLVKLGADIADHGPEGHSAAYYILQNSDRFGLEFLNFLKEKIQSHPGKALTLEADLRKAGVPEAKMILPEAKEIVKLTLTLPQNITKLTNKVLS